MFRAFASWLSATGPSTWMQTHDWVVPTSQSIHIACVGLLLTSALAINARLLGWGGTGRSIAQLTGALLPVMGWSFAGLLLTGLLQTVTEPMRQFVTPVFWAKMLAIAIVVPLTLAFARRLRAAARPQLGAGHRPRGALAFAIATSLLWIAIVVFGRFIGYTSYDYL